jgi:hypothetical protein
MSTNFAVRLQQQMHGSAFDYLNQQLGVDLVSAIPTVDLSSLKALEGLYPDPWKDPKDLPADIVKAVLPSGRPMVAVRYVHQEKDKESLRLMIIFQRYSSKMPPLIPSNKFPYSQYGTISTSEMVSDWTETWGGYINNTGRRSDTFQWIRSLANGESLDKTDGRYLPMYADLYAVKV